MIVARVLFSLLLLCASKAEEKNKHNVTTLRLIAVVPLTIPTTPAQWERGPEILPGARLAVDEINSMSVLSGYELELVVVDEAGCRPDTSVLSFYEQVAGNLGSRPSLTVGVVGLMCPAVAKAMQALCGVPGGISLVHLSAGPSSIRASEKEGPMARGMIADSAAYASMIAALLDELGVTGFGVLYSGRSDAYSYYLPTAEAIGRQIGAAGNKVTYMRQVEITDVDETVADLQMGAVTAVYTSLDVATTALVLCAAGRMNLVWPNFAWLVLDHEAFELIAANKCSTVELAKGLEGAIFVRRNLEPVELDRKLVTGGAYQEYLEALKNYSPYALGADTFKSNPYANVLYDAVWSVALALNNSLQNHLGLGSGAGATLSKWVEKGLPTVSFNGAHDFVDFGDKNKTTTDHSIRVDQIISGKPKLLGYYYTTQNRMEIINPLEQQQNISKWLAVQTRYILIPTVVAGIVLALTGIIAILTTVELILLLYYRTESEIKATSPKISIFMFIGCYLLCAAIGLEVAFRTTVVEGKATKVACNATVWPASIGLNLILATLVVRLARVYYLFSHIRVLQKERELWTDRTLFCVVLLVVLGNIVLLTVWAVVDNYHVEDDKTSTSATEPSSIHQHCKSTYLMLWLPLICLYSLVLIGAIIILTTLTRKIKRRHFKDTKKVNVFIFMLFITCSIMIPLWWVSKFVNYTLSGTLLCLCYGITATLCQLLLFVPKTIPPFIRDVFKTKLMEEQLASSTDSERKRPSLLRKMSSTAI